MPRTASLQLPTGVCGLDELLGGGLPQGSCTLIGGDPGSGKTTLALQVAFANGSEEHPALYFAGVGERAARARTHHAEQCFFTPERLDRDVFLIDIGPHNDERDAGRVLESLTAQLDFYQPSVVVVDLPRALTPASLWHNVLLLLAQTDVTSVLVTEGHWMDPDLAQATAVVDNIAWLEHMPAGRGIRALKARGHSVMPGIHALELSDQGMRVFPRWPTPLSRGKQSDARVSTGVEALDRLIGGGLLAGSSVVVSGGSGTGKSVMATQFVAEAGHQGLPGLVVLVEERPERFVQRAEALDLQLDRLMQGGLVEMLSLRGRDISPDELMYLVQRGVANLGAQRVVVDSVGGLEMLLHSREAVHDCVWRMLDGLSAMGVTVWLNQSSGLDERLAALADQVWHLRRTDEGRRLDVVKSSAAVEGTGRVRFEIGHGGFEVVAARAASNGHLVNYRYAVG